MPENSHPVFDLLRGKLADGPIVVAHRGDSGAHPENTLAAFTAARQLGVGMQEFDVRATRDHVLCCIHDESFDRTTNAGKELGPGALVAEATWAEARRLDAGTWCGAGTGQRLPSLAEALAAMLPDCVPLIEHKAGEPADYLRVLSEVGATTTCILQSFDWAFVAAARVACPQFALAALGPTPHHARLDDAAIEAALRLGVGMLHWRDRDLTRRAVDRVHDAGLLVCTYTTDDELGWRGGASLGVDAMCTNHPAAMLALRRDGQLRRGRG